MDVSDKIILIIIVGGIASAVIIALIKVGEIMVKRRTEALIAEHRDVTDDEKTEPRE